MCPGVSRPFAGLTRSTPNWDLTPLGWGRAAQADVLFFVDADAIAQVAAILNREPDVAAVFGSYDDALSESSFLSLTQMSQTGASNAHPGWPVCFARL